MLQKSTFAAVICTAAGLLASPVAADDNQIAFHPVSVANEVTDNTIESAELSLDLNNLDGGHDHNVKHGRVDTHAPAFLMGGHVHDAGQWMFEYKYINMHMNGNRAGTTNLSDMEALDFNGFMATPLQMNMEMHMMHIMRGMTDNVTAWIMPMWMVNTMDHLRRTGSTFVAVNSGISDLHFGALWRVYDGCDDELIVNFHFRAPTADLGTLPYPMRIGQGTWGALPAITYRKYWDRASLGLQGQWAAAIGRNERDYRVGNEYRANAWLSYLLDDEKNLATTFRVEGLWRSNFVGADPGLVPGMISTADPDMRGGDFLNLGYGLMYMLPEGGRLNFELTNPVVQNLTGVQLKNDWAIAASYSKAY